MDDTKKAYLDYTKVIEQEKIPHYDVRLGDEELKQVLEVVKSNWLSEGVKTREFEKKFCELVGTKYAFATANCSGGLMMALRAVGVKRDDEVIVPTFTHMGSVSCIGLVGGVPTFVDIDSKSTVLFFRDNPFFSNLSDLKRFHDLKVRSDVILITKKIRFLNKNFLRNFLKIEKIQTHHNKLENLVFQNIFDFYMRLKK